MANPEHLAILGKGVAAWNDWRLDNHSERPDLSMATLDGANLSGANLGDANLAWTFLRRANLYGANLDGANLTGATLDDANLSHAILDDANLYGARLMNANLRMASLMGSNLTVATVDGTEFGSTVFSETVFASVKLSSAYGLETCFHESPSIIDHRTLQKSGPLPVVFLRGCGLPDNLIEFLPSLRSNAVQSVFISYSTKDEKFARQLHGDLQAKGVRCWFAPHQVQGGKKLHEQIDEAIRIYDRLLLILSEDSISSAWVAHEIAKARAREQREKKRMLFPVRLVDYETLRAWECFDADAGKDSAKEIREYYIPDFSRWKEHDMYAGELDRLIRDLKTE